MTIDMHAHTGSFEGFVRGGEHTIDTLVAAWDEAGVEAGLISNLDSHDPAGANDRTVAACERHPGRVFGYVYLNPTDVRGALAELNRRAGDDRFRGVKLHPSLDVYFPFLELYYPVYERIQELGLPMLWHCGTYPYSSPLQIAYVARLFPGVPFVLAHFALADLSWESFPAASLADNVHVDTSGNPILPLMDEWLDRFGADRMLWGSDFPFYQVRYELEKVDRLGCDDAARALIREGNARRLFSL